MAKKYNWVEIVGLSDKENFGQIFERIVEQNLPYCLTQLTTKVFKEGRTLKPLAENKSLNLGTTNGKRIDLAQIICTCGVITLSIYLQS